MQKEPASGPEATTSSFCIPPSSLANWLPGIDSHDHSRRQRALSYWLDDPANGLESRPGLAPGKERVAAIRLDNFGMRLLIGASGGSCTRTVDALDVVPRWPRANAWATRANGAPGRIRTCNRAPVRCFPRIRRSLCRLSYWGAENGGMPWTCATSPEGRTG
jgi:hypothetical protein